MHETAVAQSLVEAITAEAGKRHARPLRATISCGALNAINDDVLSFAFEALARGTACEGMGLQIEHKPLQARCHACERLFVVDWAALRCPDCDNEDFEVLPDAPLMLEQIEFEGAEDGEG